MTQSAEEEWMTCATVAATAIALTAATAVRLTTAALGMAQAQTTVPALLIMDRATALRATTDPDRLTTVQVYLQTMAPDQAIMVLVHPTTVQDHQAMVPATAAEAAMVHPITEAAAAPATGTAIETETTTEVSLTAPATK